MAKVVGSNPAVPKKHESYFSFLRRRILRIYPGYWLALGFAFLVAFALAKSFSWLDVACSVTGFCAFVGEWGGSILPISWFVGLIICLYALFPALSRGFRARPWTCLATLFCISLASKIAVSQFVFVGPRALDWFPLSRLFEFGLGVFLAEKAGKRFTFLDNTMFAKQVNFLGRHSFELFLFHYPLMELVLK